MTTNEIISKLTRLGPGLEGVMKLVVLGEPPAAHYIDLAALEPVTRPERGVACIMRGYSADLNALLDGRMSLSNGIISERVALIGELAALARLRAALRKEN